MLILRANPGDRSVAAQAAAALAQLKSSWPPDDFRSYLKRPLIHKMYTELLRADPGAPAVN